jgi:ferric-dicitrate binding protein FerR (iron transport regulator)
MMNETENRRPFGIVPGGGEAPPENDSVGRLLRTAGPRPTASPEALAAARHVAHAAWRQKVTSHAEAQRRRWNRFAYAAAAVLVLGVGVATFLRLGSLPGTPAAAATVAEVEALFGAVELTGEVTGEVTGGTAPASGAELAAGTELTTGDRSRAALRLAGGQTVRVDAGTEIRLAAADRLELRRGAVYLDSAGAPAGASVAVETRYGVARDVGTRFEVRVVDDAVRVLVREGEVAVRPSATRTDADVQTADAGTALTVHADGTVEARPVNAWGDPWRWLLDAAPPFELEGKTLAEFLDWVTRETGWHLRYADPDLEREAATIVVHGSIEGLRPDQTPTVVLPSSGLEHHLEDGTLFIERGE